MYNYFENPNEDEKSENNQAEVNNISSKEEENSIPESPKSGTDNNQPVPNDCDNSAEQATEEKNNIPPQNQTYYVPPTTPQYPNNQYPPYYNQNQMYNQGNYQNGYINNGYQNKYYQQQRPVQPYEYSPNQFDNNEVVSPEPIKKSKTGIIVFAVIIAVFLITVIALIGFAFTSNAGLENKGNGNLESGSPSGAPVITIEGTDENSSSNNEVTQDMTLTAQIANNVAPSVVAIKIEINQRGYSTIASAGSGIIVSEDGYIATNYHVVEYADIYPKITSVSVLLDDGKEYDADFIAGDSKNDIAVIKIDAKNLQAAKMGNSDSLSRGEFVMAIGNPLGEYLEGSVSLGVVSATGRTGIDSTSIAYIQTDAAINPGNSGGPLINMDGQVVGINSAKVVLDGYEGIGFAIPSSFAVNVINELISTGEAPSYAFIGIEYTEITETNSSAYNLPVGLRIISIYDESKIDKSKVKVGDIIVAADGKAVSSATDMSTILASKKPGDTISLTLFRPQNGNGEKFNINVTLISSNDIDDSQPSTQFYNY